MKELGSPLDPSVSTLGGLSCPPVCTSGPAPSAEGRKGHLRFGRPGTFLRKFVYFVRSDDGLVLGSGTRRSTGVYFPVQSGVCLDLPVLPDLSFRRKGEGDELEALRNIRVGDLPEAPMGLTYTNAPACTSGPVLPGEGEVSLEEKDERELRIIALDYAVQSFTSGPALRRKDRRRRITLEAAEKYLAFLQGKPPSPSGPVLPGEGEGSLPVEGEGVKLGYLRTGANNGGIRFSRQSE
jgi:hypothetical protein